MKIIGITGSVGSGKTTVARCLEQEFGARLLLTDEIAHMFMQPEEKGYLEIVRIFTDDILEENTSWKQDAEGIRGIDRKKLGACVFGQPEKVKILNDIIHPLVNQYVARVIEEEKQRGTLSYLVIESALLIEAGYEAICDELWYVTADDKVRRERLKASRGYSDEKIDAILKNQLSDDEFRNHCAKIFINNGDAAEISRQVQVLLELS